MRRPPVWEAAFLDEVSKIAQRSYGKDFLAGVDPTGTKTFQYGMQDERQGKASPLRRAVGTAGGVAGGIAAIPLAVGGTVGGIRGFAMGQGGIGRRLLSAGRGALSGAVKPYQQLYRGTRARGALSAHRAGKQLTSSQASHLQKFVKTQLPEGLGAAQITPGRVQTALRAMSPEQTAWAQRQLSGELAQGAGALGLSGAISGGSAYMQYGKGAKTEQNIKQRIEKARRR